MLASFIYLYVCLLCTFPDIQAQDMEEELEMEGFSCPTQERFDDMAEEATNDASMPDYKRKFNKENVHGKLPKTNLDKIVIPYKRLMVDLDNAIEDTRYKDDENKEERQIYFYHYGIMHVKCTLLVKIDSVGRANSFVFLFFLLK